MLVALIFMEEEFESSTALKFRALHACSVREKNIVLNHNEFRLKLKKHPVLRCITSWLGVCREHLQVVLSCTPPWRHFRGLSHLLKALELCTHTLSSTHNPLSVLCHAETLST